MHPSLRMTSVAAASALVISLSPSAAAAAAEPCVTGAQVRTQVAALVDDLRDDVRSRPARAALAHALVDTLATFRGAKADTPAERQALGQKIAALARQLRSATTRVERKALILDILALAEQRERGAFTAAERAEIRAALDALRNAVIAKTDTPREDQQVAAAFRNLHTQLSCRP